jgi:malate dehydrogenase
VPVKLGRNGIEQVIELQLNDEEMKLLHNSADAVREVVNVYNSLPAEA